MKFGQKFFREIDLFDLTSFLGLDFLKFSGPLCLKFVGLSYFNVGAFSLGSENFNSLIPLLHRSAAILVGLAAIITPFSNFPKSAVSKSG